MTSRCSVRALVMPDGRPQRTGEESVGVGAIREPRVLGQADSVREGSLKRASVAMQGSAACFDTSSAPHEYFG